MTAVLVSNPSHCTVTLNSNGSFIYSPSASYTGTDSFTYQASDGQADSNIATVTISVTATTTSNTVSQLPLVLTTGIIPIIRISICSRP